MFLNTASKVSLVVVLALFLSACESSEERAEKHFQSGMELLEAGDVDRAMVEFRNVFELDGLHRGARLAYASVLLDRGNLGEAYRNYLLIAEQTPDDLETRLILAELAATNLQWEEARRHFEAVETGGLVNPRSRAVGIALRYRDAIDEEMPESIDAAAVEAESLVVELPDSILLRRVLVDYNLRNQRTNEALEQVEKALEIEPDSRPLHDIKLSLLAQLADTDGLEGQLVAMIQRFPDDANLEATLVRFYVSQDRVDDAEAYLRKRAEAAEEDKDQAYIDLVRFIVEIRGIEAGLSELEAAISSDPQNLTLVSLQAGLLYDVGNSDEAINILEAALAEQELTPETSAARLTLANILLRTGNEVGSRRLVEQILSVDPGNVEALKLSAEWLIEGDQPDEAISALRLALDQAPEDPEIMTLMAYAHNRNGSRQLARDMLARAVETSNSGPQESIRYSQVLVDEENYLAAEDVLIDSLRLNVNNVQLLNALGRVYVRSQDWPRANQVVGTLRRIESDDAKNAADGIQVAILAGQDRTDETVEFLEQLSTGEEQNVAARIAIAGAHLAAGNEAAAIESIESTVAADPNSPSLQFARGAIYAAVGEFETAESAYRGILDQNPNAERVWIELMRVLNAQGKREDALAVLDEGLEVLPGAPNLLWARASTLEQNGDYEGAIAVYEELYAENPNAPVIANNLASMISTYRTDEESLERAYTVARRLRGVEFAPFQDTYGWIAFRRGDLEDALEHLEPAAAGLPDDALVQYHLAKTFLALDRKEEALAQFRRSAEIAGESDLRPQIAEARQQIRDLEVEIGAE